MCMLSIYINLIEIIKIDMSNEDKDNIRIKCIYF